MSTTPTIDSLMIATFDKPRDPRSAAYKAGARALFARFLHGTAIRCAYPAGSAENDAFYAGIDEGNLVMRNSGIERPPVAA